MHMAGNDRLPFPRCGIPYQLCLQSFRRDFVDGGVLAIYHKETVAVAAESTWIESGGDTVKVVYL